MFQVVLMTLRLIYSICGLVSLFFLVLTLYFYATLPELNTFHGKIDIADPSFYTLTKGELDSDLQV